MKTKILVLKFFWEGCCILWICHLFDFYILNWHFFCNQNLCFEWHVFIHKLNRKSVKSDRDKVRSCNNPENSLYLSPVRQVGRSGQVSLFIESYRMNFLDSLRSGPYLYQTLLNPRFLNSLWYKFHQIIFHQNILKWGPFFQKFDGFSINFQNLTVF